MKNTLTLLLLSLALYVPTGCKKGDISINDNIVNLRLNRKIPSLDPAKAYDVISHEVMAQAHETLFQYNYLKRPYTLIPLLAKEMPKLDESKTTYTIKIKKNIRYHDDPAFKGKMRFLKAQDFITQIKRVAFKGTKSNGVFLFEGRILGFNQFRKKVGVDFKKFKKHNIQGLKAIDELTLEIKLTRPFPQLLYALAMNFSSPIPMEIVEHYNNDLEKVLVGTGPFYLKEFDPDQRVHFKKSPHYQHGIYPGQGDRFANEYGLLKDANKKLPFLDGLIFHVIKDDKKAWEKFLSKKLDLLPIPKDRFNEAINHQGKLSKDLQKQGIVLQIAPTLTSWWIAFNMKDPILGKNKYLRLAIAHAIDIEQFIQQFTNNTGQQAYSIFPPGIPGYTPSNKLPFSYDLELAKRYLDMAGHKDGEDLPEFNYDERGDNATYHQIAKFIQSQLKKIDVNIKINLNNYPDFLQKQRSGKLQLARDGWALDYPDAENIIQLLYSKNKSPGPNASNFHLDQFDNYVHQLRPLENGPKKFELMHKMENLAHQVLPWIMLYYERRYTLHHRHLKNYRYGTMNQNYVKFLKLKAGN